MQHTFAGLIKILNSNSIAYFQDARLYPTAAATYYLMLGAWYFWRVEHGEIASESFSAFSFSFNYFIDMHSTHTGTVTSLPRLDYLCMIFCAAQKYSRLTEILAGRAIEKLQHIYFCADSN